MIHTDIKQLAEACFDSQGNRYAKACGYICKRVLFGYRQRLPLQGLEISLRRNGPDPQSHRRTYTPKTKGKTERYGLRATSSTSDAAGRMGALMRFTGFGGTEPLVTALSGDI